MPRKQLIRSNEHPYHVSARANNREFFKVPLDSVWQIFIQQLSELEERFHIQVHSFVLMGNHFHLVLTVPEKDLGTIMQHLIQSVTKTLNQKAGRSGRVFGSRYHGSIITSPHHFDGVMKYVYRNPVKAGLCENVERYPFSTLSCVLGSGSVPFELHPPFEEKLLVPENDPLAYRAWLNRPFPNEIDQQIKAALQKTRFQPSLDRRYRKIAQSEFEKSIVFFRERGIQGLDAVGIKK